MMKAIKTYKPFSVIVVPFPFTDQERAKRRPALVISSEEHQQQSSHVSLLMITSAKNSEWPNDYLIQEIVRTGLSAASIVRQKLFTIDSRLVIKLAGELSLKDRREVSHALRQHLCHLNL